MRNPNTTTGTSWANHDASEARRLSELVDARKRSEQDAELLSNRIALLRAEGIRTEKRIAEARRRAEELINAKRKSAEAKIQRANKDDSEYKRLELIRMRACEQREGARNRIKEKLEWVQDSKMKLYKKARDDRIAVIELKGRQHAEAMRAAQERRKYVRRSHNKAAEARMKLVEDRQIQRRAEMEERCRREEAMMKVKEEEIDSMERVEKCLIRRLQDSQKRQRETYRYLQDILEAHPSSFLVGSFPTSTTVGGNDNEDEEDDEEEEITLNRVSLPQHVQAPSTTVDVSSREHSDERVENLPSNKSAAPVVSYTTADGVVVSLSDILDDHDDDDVR